MPLQECDALLHEAGAPPIHTPLSVLQNLPEKIRERLYVVHTSALPPDSGLRVAPTGTAGTIRLDGKRKDGAESLDPRQDTSISFNTWCNDAKQTDDRTGDIDDNKEYSKKTPLVLDRPSCISDAWFMLNLISNIPFFSSLSYMNTMEVLEVATIEIFSAGEIVVPARKRQDILCVIWEGTCVEHSISPEDEVHDVAIWHAGDWSGPIALQPNTISSVGSSQKHPARDVIALSESGVKVISLSMADVSKILLKGSRPYRKFMEAEGKVFSDKVNPRVAQLSHPSNLAARHVLDTLKINSVLGSLHARQIRALESIAEGPRAFDAGEYLWRAGGRCDYAFLIAAGTASFRPLPGRNISMSHGSRNHRQASGRNVMEVSDGVFVEADKVLHDLPPVSEFSRLELLMALRAERMEIDPDYRSVERVRRKGDHKTSDRNANKVFARLYSSRKCIDGLMVSRGCFLADTSKMVSGELVTESDAVAKKHLHS
jgi:hypothetical protein